MHIERADAVKRLKKALRTITGKTWSVSGARGTAWGWIDIQAPKSRRVGHTPNPAWKHWEMDTQEPPFFENPDAPKDERWYTNLADEAVLRDIFDMTGFYIHQGMSVPPDSREWYVLKAEEKAAAMTGNWTSAPVGPEPIPVEPEAELKVDPNRPTWLLTGPEDPKDKPEAEPNPKVCAALLLDNHSNHYQVRMDPDEALEFTAALGDYNSFEPAKAVKLIEKINGLFDKPPHTYRVGREYSHVMYLDIVKAYLPAGNDYDALANTLSGWGLEAKADEAGVTEDGNGMFTFRFWWD